MTGYHHIHHTWLSPTISSRAALCLPKSGPAVSGTGDLIVVCSGFESIKALLAKVGYADLFCFETVLRVDVSTRRGGGRALKSELGGGETSTGVVSCFRIRDNREFDNSLGSLLDLSLFAVVADGGGAPSGPGATPGTGSSV